MRREYDCASHRQCSFRLDIELDTENGRKEIIGKIAFLRNFRSFWLFSKFIHLFKMLDMPLYTSIDILSNVLKKLLAHNVQE